MCFDDITIVVLQVIINYKLRQTKYHTVIKGASRNAKTRLH